MAFIDKLYRTNFLEYASYVIKDRAIPHIDDGLKPVQRRILHTLFEMDDGKFNKVANVVGHCMRYHPHGDASIFAALIVLANKEMFIERQGNFGNIYTGDPASAARYIECRLLPLGREVLYNPHITEYEDSYDGRNKEPITLPAKVPVLLAQGTEGIAVGMATKILPHNFIELMEAQIACLRKKKFKLYPDFPTGGRIDVSEYNDGNGRVVVRAYLDDSDPKRIVVRELPYGMTTQSLIESIEAAARKNKIKVSGIDDYTTEKVEIEIKLARGVLAKDTMDALYAFTDCESSISSNLMVIKDNVPQVLSVTEVIKHNTERLVEILTAELKLERRNLNDRLHAKTLEQIFIEKRVYKAIEKMDTSQKVIKAVFKGLQPYKNKIKRDITDEDLDNLLKIPIRRISVYDINKAKKEMADIRKRLKEIKAALDSIKKYSIAYLKNIIATNRDKYPRRTQITAIEQVDAREVAQRNLKLRYDKKTGYLGYNVSGDVLVDASPYDRILVIRKTGTYSVMNVPEKAFVDKRMLYCDFVDKDREFNIIYKQEKTGHPFIKRCKIDKFILNKGYALIPDDCKMLALSLDSTDIIGLEYKPKPRVRVKREEFKIEDFPVRGNKAGGIRLAKRDLEKAVFFKGGKK